MCVEEGVNERETKGETETEKRERTNGLTVLERVHRKCDQSEVGEIGDEK